jgi:hypothetical protein
MEEYRIARSHGPELVFEGVCITTASDRPDNERTPGRWHEISVYRRADDTWLASIQYHTRFAEEEGHTEAEIINDASELESVLLSYEPWEHIDRRALGRLSSDDRKRQSQRIWTNYLDLVNRVLDDVIPFSPTPVSGTGTDTPPRKPDPGDDA